jgi:hypothetical protein
MKIELFAMEAGNFMSRIYLALMGYTSVIHLVTRMPQINRWNAKASAVDLSDGDHHNFPIAAREIPHVQFAKSINRTASKSIKPTTICPRVASIETESHIGID